METKIITYNLKDRGRQYRGKERNFNIRSIVSAINGPACQERVKNRDMLGYYGHWPRIKFGMNPAEAASTPRIHHQWLPDELRVEKGLSPDTLAILQRQGYKVSVKPTMGRTQTIQLRDDGLYGYSDPRNPDGATIGY
jgi:hypothetical protein